MNYSGIHLTLNPLTTDYLELLSAMLDLHDFEGITEIENGLIGYMAEVDFYVEMLFEIRDVLNKAGCYIDWQIEQIPSQNWNALWESNFEPVLIGDHCIIRAPFHDPFNDIPIRITIEPKMSFGTGHHQTTRLMIEHMLECEFTGKKVLDMGCGTGVLGILASKLGALDVYCLDIDPWAHTNTRENIARNGAENMHAIQGGKESIPDKKFDFILANINRNVLMDQMPHYASITERGSKLLISGFLEEDAGVFIQNALSKDFSYKRSKVLNGWMSVLYERK